MKQTILFILAVLSSLITMLLIVNDCAMAYIIGIYVSIYLLTKLCETV